MIPALLLTSNWWRHPNNWRKGKVTTKQERATSGRQEAYRDFFQGLIDRLREKHQFTGAKKGQPQSWYSFASGFSGVTYGANFTQEEKARGELYIDRGDKDQNETLFDALRENQEAIESALQESLEWQRMEGRKACRIAVTRPGGHHG